MTREDFDHVITAAARVTGERELVVIGSQAILGSIQDPPEELLRSMEADLYPRHDPAKADEIDGALGDGSMFHEQFGCYAHGVGPETAKAPAGWEDRLIRIEVPGRLEGSETSVAWCLEPHDLVLSKCAAGRDKDWDYARCAIHAEIVDPRELLRRVDGLPVPERLREHVRDMLGHIAAEPGRG